MFNRVFRYYSGRVFIKISGENLENFINQAVKDGIIFYKGRKLPDFFLAEINTADFKKLRNTAKASGIRITLQAKYGFPFVMLRWKRRKGLLIGLVIVFTILTVLSQLVLSISVEGNERISTEQILAEGEKLGLKTWVWKKDLDLENLSKQLQESNPDLIWATIEERGTNINIRVVEKTLPQKVTAQGDLVAAKTGFVDQVIVIQGTPVVKEGDTVKKGQVLIKAAGGMTEYSIDVSNNSDAKKNLIDAPAAKGFVRGRVWYSAEKEVLLAEDFTEKTGRSANGWGIKIQDRVIMITNPNCPYEQAIELTQSYALPAWRNWRFPVEIIKVCYEETQNVHIERTVDEARQFAENQAREKIRSVLPAEAQVLKEKVRIRTSEQGVEYVRVEVETFEELAVYKQ